MRCLITGVTGFTGIHLATVLSGLRGIELFGIARISRRLSVPLKFSQCDVRDRFRVRRLIRRIRPRYVFHLAGLTHGSSLKDMLEVNVLGTEAVLEAAAEVDSVVLVPGSAAEYGSPLVLPISEDHPARPRTAYGVAKAAQVHLALQMQSTGGPRVMVARPFTVAGPKQPGWFVCAELAERVAHLSPSQTLKVGNPRIRRDFVDVRDLVWAYWLIVTKGTPGQVYNVCSGIGRSIGEVARTLLECRGIRAKIQKMGGREKTEPVVVIGSPEKIRREVGWQPTINFRQMLSDLFGRSNPPVATQILAGC